jgi:hypothetical protein
VARRFVESVIGKHFLRATIPFARPSLVRDRVPLLDGKKCVFVRKLCESRRQEGFARHLEESLQRGEILDPALTKLRLDHAGSSFAVLVHGTDFDARSTPSPRSLSGVQRGSVR